MSTAPAASRSSSTPRFLREIEPGTHVDDQICLVISKHLRTGRTGSMYIEAMVGDRSGQMPARLWNASQALADSIPEGALLYVKGRVEAYRGSPQLIIDAVRAVPEGEANPSDFLPSTSGDVEQMWTRLKEILRGVRQRDLLALLGKFVNDPLFAANFKRAPAARTLHHAYLGGLLEHTLGLLELASVVLPRYPDVNADLVLAGIFLHDAGKTAELAYKTSFEYTNEGQLLGHIVQATIWVADKARELEHEQGRPLPADLLAALQHILVAHHGRYEFGSPKLPATREAVMVHYLDNLDAKLNMMRYAVEHDVDDASDWTGWIAALETRIFKPNRFD